MRRPVLHCPHADDARFDMCGIIAEHYAEPDSEQKSYEEIKRVMSLMDVEDSGIKVLHGAKQQWWIFTLP